MNNGHDIVILGSGSTAFAAALRAQALGAKVLMIERSELGGTCINWGCIPSKTLIHSATLYQEREAGARMGLGSPGGQIDLDRLLGHKESVVDYLKKTKYLDILASVPGLTLLKGTGRFVGPHELEAAGRRINCDKILIATGGFPRIPEIPGIHDISYLTSRSALLLKEFPASLLIIGGGVIALELGQMFHRFGTKVTILEHGPRTLPAVETEPALALQQALVDEGLSIVVNTDIKKVAKLANHAVVHAEVDGRPEEFTAERILLAVGTAPATSGIGLHTAGVELDHRGYIKVDDRMRTSVPGIWGAGDVVGGMMIATVGAREGIVAVEDMLNSGCGCRIDNSSTPMAIFTDPEVAMVGLGEEAARKAGFDVVTSVLPASAIPKAHVTGNTAGALKIVADAASTRILGVHISCYRASELIHEAALAVKHGLTIEDVATTLHVYPSMAEGLRLCAQGFSRDVAKLSCCAE